MANSLNHFLFFFNLIFINGASVLEIRQKPHPSLLRGERRGGGCRETHQRVCDERLKHLGGLRAQTRCCKSANKRQRVHSTKVEVQVFFFKPQEDTYLRVFAM